ncbi:unnamed protein product, partial [Iphiclides podalirius]
MARYDRAVTVFSPDGQLLQVQYAQEAVRKGSPVVGVRGSDAVVLATEKRTVGRLQEERTEGKIAALDEHVALAYAGLRADARVLIARGQIECQSHRLIVEDPASVEHVARYLAALKQEHTQSNGRRPYGVSCLVGGVEYDGTPRLFQTEPSGTFYEWKACAIGRGEKTARESLEKEYSASLVDTDTGAVRLALSSLMEVVHSGQRNLDVLILKKFQPIVSLKPEEIIPIVEEIEKNKESNNK